MATRFLYIDDENDESTNSISEGLEIRQFLKVTLSEPQQFREQKTFFIEQLQNYDGVILDLRLDGKRLDIPYNAPALAQELRMMAAEGTVPSIPIILCSTEEKMRATYEVDKTSHDLFDYKFHKQATPPWEKFARKINSLALGYKIIEKCNYDFNSIFNREMANFDIGIFEKFQSLDKNLPTFEYAAFIVKDFFHHPGILIKETLLAARLGIDVSKSKEAWPQLLEILIDTRYTGVFSDGWARWWSDLILARFKEITGKRLAQINAEERVALLSEKLNLKGLISATPLPRNISKNFWAICEFYKMPIDPLEGFKIHTSIENKSWQESKYISLEAVLNKRGPKPHSSELNRIELIKESLSQK